MPSNMIISVPTVSKKHFPLLVLLIGLSSQSICAQCRSTSSDTSFAALGSTTGYSPEFHGDGAPSYLRVTRVVGPGTAALFNTNGTLLNAATYQQNGVVSSKAYVQVFAQMTLGSSFWELASIGGFPLAAQAEVTFTLNGVRIRHPYVLTAQMTGSATVSSNAVIDCFPVNTNLVRFARLTNGGGPCPSSSHYDASKDTTCPGNNEVEALIRFRLNAATSANIDPLPALNQAPFLALTSPKFVAGLIASVSTVVRGTQLSFNAMAPVMLVHGIRAGPSNDRRDLNWFDPYPFVPGTPTFYQSNWFRQPFDDAKAPYSVLKFDEDRIEQGGSNLAAPIQQAAAAFGARYIHIVAHSKGGLWSRAFLANQLSSLSPAIGVFSLTTLATPHHGSYNADLRVLVHDHASDPNYQFTPFQWALSVWGPWTQTSTRDLRTDAVKEFNGKNHLPTVTTVLGRKNKIYYYETWGDANLDGSCQGLSAGHPL
jgi:hypothetical protein